MAFAHLVSRRRYFVALAASVLVVAVYGLVSFYVVDPVTTLPAATGYGYGRMHWVGRVLLIWPTVLWFLVALPGVGLAVFAAAGRRHLPLLSAVGGVLVAVGWVAAASVISYFGVGFSLYSALEQTGEEPATGGGALSSIALYIAGPAVLLIGAVLYGISLALGPRSGCGMRRSSPARSG